MQRSSPQPRVVAQLKDRSLRPEYARRLAGWLGMDIDIVLARVAEAADRPQGQGQQHRRTAAVQPEQRPVEDRPDPKDRELFSERESLKIAMQRPVLAGPVFDGLEDEMFTSAAYRSVRAAIAAAGGCGRPPGDRAGCSRSPGLPIQRRPRRWRPSWPSRPS